MLTINKIAQLANVSRGTVDRVLNNRGSVKPETAEKVLSIANSMNYKPNFAGKALAIKKMHLKFGFILNNATKNPFFTDVEKGIELRMDEFANFGVEIIRRYTAIDSPEQQVQAIEELLTLGVNGLAITPINHPMVCKKLRELSQMQIPVVAVNTDISNSGRIAYVGSDYYLAGATAAGLMNIICSGAANVGVVVGSLSILCHSERISGFKSRCMQNYPNLQVIDIVINRDDDIESYRVTTELLKTHPEINALYLVSAGVVGACRAVTDLTPKRDIRIISHDVSPSTCSLLKDGIIQATITQDPFFQGKKPLDILLDYLGMGTEPERECFFTKNDILICENCESSI